MLAMTYNAFFPENSQSFLDSVNAAWDFAEVVVAERFLFSTVGAMVRCSHLQVPAEHTNEQLLLTLTQ